MSTRPMAGPSAAAVAGRKYRGGQELLRRRADLDQEPQDPLRRPLQVRCVRLAPAVRLLEGELVDVVEGLQLLDQVLLQGERLLLREAGRADLDLRDLADPVRLLEVPDVRREPFPHVALADVEHVPR